MGILTMLGGRPIGRITRLAVRPSVCLIQETNVKTKSEIEANVRALGQE